MLTIVRGYNRLFHSPVMELVMGKLVQYRGISVYPALILDLALLTLFSKSS